MPITTHRGLRFAILVFALLSITLAHGLAATQYTLLHGFTGMPSDGANPQYGALATDGTTLYGLTLNGGSANSGTIFKIGVSGSGYQTLHSFTGLFAGTGDSNDGAHPYGTPLLIGSTLYGTTLYGGTNGFGAVFKINTDGGGFQLLHSFGAIGDGYGPYCSLATDGTNLFGITSASSSGLGTIFKIGTNGGSYSILHNFIPAAQDGANSLGSLIFSGGTLYGMAQMGGALGSGTIFKIGTDGSGFQLVHTFTGVATDGALPYGSLTIANTTLYGMTSAGGANNLGCVFSVDTSGSGFQILHSFSTTTTWNPYGDLTLANSTLYGMAHIGGTNGLGFGTIFQLNTSGSGFQVLHTFFYAFPNNLTDGSTPYGSMIFLDSKLYGMTQAGGSSHNAGALFSFTPTTGGGGGSGPTASVKVTILPAAAVKAGAQWQINGGALMKSGTLLSNLTAGAHVVSFSTIPGYTTPAPQIIDLTVGTVYPVTGTYIAADTTAPTIKAVSPTSKTTVNSNLFTATGTASDNVGVALVYYQLNGGDWTPAASFNSWTNWTAANLNLTPGLNTIKFTAKDLSGNFSATNTVSFTYVVSAPLVVTVNLPGGGTFKPTLNGQLLQIGKSFSISFKAAKGFAFVKWSGSTDTTSPKISFLMASNLAFTAIVKDITRPVNVILTPTKGQTLTGATPMATGKAMDNVGVAAVWYKVNSGPWTMANVLNGTNWQTADLSSVLLSGADSISAYAIDAAGNISLTNTIAFLYAVHQSADWAPDSLNGLLATVTPANGSPESVGFDISAFAQASTTGSTDSQDYGAGAYIYLKIDTNLAQLSLMATTPPISSNNVGPVDLVFTNPYSGFFSNEDSGDLGGINFTIAHSFVPTTLTGKTVSAVSTGGGKTVKIKLATAVAFTKTPANNSHSGSSSGTYTFTRFGPVNGMLAFSFTSPGDAGQSAYVQLTFTSATGGTYFAMIFDSLGNLTDTDAGSFTM
ncbi:MAG TPA: choice-of-anchor tandem repeat GloVer-containing protein [Verrucomicrobiae bacterium]|jgi:uncharacterized repeat protein (TIGR03803 family)|nr:choice-of-anchor tandem repeat GloVer-containing protein [Verrucomicrobiae bacterium]